ncbi:MAG: metal-dependent hydrolase [Archaeoglobaceae archaeon]
MPNRLGHIGASLTLSLFFPPDVTLIAALLSLSPDTDLVLGLKHREYTHNVAFASLVAAVALVLFGRTVAIASFAAVLLHILLDLTTKQKFPALFPLSRKRYGLRLFRSNSTLLNSSLLVVGVLVFVWGNGYAVHT